jgi:hypothetical protein
MKNDSSKLDLLETLFKGCLEEIAHLKRAKQLLQDVYFEADRKGRPLSWEKFREIHCFLGFDEGEDE